MSSGGTAIPQTDATAMMRATLDHIEQGVMIFDVMARLTGTIELEPARDEAERANASKSRFVASASHDLLQPLNAVKLFLASFAATGQSPAQARLTDRVCPAFRPVEQILNALPDISRFDIGAARAKPGCKTRPAAMVS